MKRRSALRSRIFWRLSGLALLIGIAAAMVSMGIEYKMSQDQWRQLDQDLLVYLSTQGFQTNDPLPDDLVSRALRKRWQGQWITTGVTTAFVLGSFWALAWVFVALPLSRALPKQWLNPDVSPQPIEHIQIPNDELGQLMTDRNRLAHRVIQLENHLNTHVHKAKSEQYMLAQRSAWQRVSEVAAAEIHRHMALLEGYGDEFRRAANVGYGAGPDFLDQYAQRLDYAVDQLRQLENGMRAHSVLKGQIGVIDPLTLKSAAEQVLEAFDRENRHTGLVATLSEPPKTLADYFVPPEWEEALLWLMSFAIGKVHQDGQGQSQPRVVQLTLLHNEGQAAQLRIQTSARPLDPSLRHEWFVPYCAVHGDPKLSLLLAMAQVMVTRLGGELVFPGEGNSHLGFYVTIPRLRPRPESSVKAAA